MDDRIAKLLLHALPDRHSPTGNDLHKATTIMTLSAMAIARSMVAEALASLATMGVPASQFTISGFMGYVARMQWEKLSALGLPRLDKFILRRTARMRKFLKANAHIANADDFINVALFLDVATYMMRHFMPTRRLTAMMTAPGVVEALPAEEFVTPAPYSDEALKCFAAINSKSFATIKTRQIAVEPVNVREMLQEVSLKVDETARIMRVAPKTLEDMCRDGRIPESIYTRFAKTGTYHFRTTKLMMFLENDNPQSQKGRR